MTKTNRKAKDSFKRVIDVWMICPDCGMGDETVLDMILDGGGARVQFSVSCNRCGTWVHMLPYTEINRAVQRYRARSG